MGRTSVDIERHACLREKVATLYPPPPPPPPPHIHTPYLLQAQGYISRKALLAAGWQPARVDGALEAMLKQGLAMIDDQGPGGERLFWFPCLTQAAAI